MIEAKSYPMENTGKKNPVKKETFEERMNRRQKKKKKFRAPPVTKDDAERGSW